MDWIRLSLFRKTDNDTKVSTMYVIQAKFVSIFKYTNLIRNTMYAIHQLQVKISNCIDSDTNFFIFSLFDGHC